VTASVSSQPPAAEAVSFRVHTVDTAPTAARPALEGLTQALGRVPNLAATMAESPTLIQGFVGAFGNFHGGSFGDAERQTLLLTNAVTNRCAWAVAFHSTMALRAGVDTADVAAIRAGSLPTAPRLAALSQASRTLIERRGHLQESEIRRFVDAGFTAGQLLEVIAGLAVSVMANYAGNITHPPLEEAFAAQAWVV
jgi:AhpD family alkylhydroperoxidase